MASETSSLPSLEPRENLADSIYRALREAIVTDALDPGYRLREVALARHFGVSTTPVREALRRLEQEGLVEISPRRGAVVATYNAQEIVELYELREVVEARAARRAAEQSERNTAVLEAILREAESVADDPDDIRFYTLDLAFHEAVGRLGGNRELARAAGRVHGQIQGLRIRHAVHLPRQNARSHEDHLAILRAIKAGDADRTEALMRRHILSVRDAVLKAVRKADPPAS